MGLLAPRRVWYASVIFPIVSCLSHCDGLCLVPCFLCHTPSTTLCQIGQVSLSVSPTLLGLIREPFTWAPLLQISFCVIMSCLYSVAASVLYPSPIYFLQTFGLCLYQLLLSLLRLSLLLMPRAGEEDLLLKRGKPLRLSVNRLKRLTSEWSGHQLRALRRLEWTRLRGVPRLRDFTF